MITNRRLHLVPTARDRDARAARWDEDIRALTLTPEQVAIIDLLDRVIALEATVSALSRVEAGNDR